MYCSQIVDLNVLWTRMKQYVCIKNELEKFGETVCPNCFATMNSFRCYACGENFEELGDELR